MEGEGSEPETESRTWHQDPDSGTWGRLVASIRQRWRGGDGVSWEHLPRDTLTSGEDGEGACGFAPKRLPQSKVVLSLPLPRRLRRPSNAPVPEASMGYAVR